MKNAIRKAAEEPTAAAGIGNPALVTRTGKTWAQWFAILDKADAGEMEHADIARYLHGQQKTPLWWSQMITVGYEQARGRRKKHEAADGFAASASRTIAVPVAELFECWRDEKALGRRLGLRDFTIRKATTPKSVRLSWSDGETVEVNFYPKGDSKSQVAIDHRKLASAAAVLRSKDFWSKVLDRLKAELEA